MYAKTALQSGATNDRSVVQTLLEAGADSDRTDCFGRDVFYYLEKSDSIELGAWMRTFERDFK